jgi:hypothetical protein
MTLVQPISEANAVSVGEGPRLVPPRSTGSSIVTARSRMEMSERAWLEHMASSLVLTFVFALMAMGTIPFR